MLTLLFAMVAELVAPLPTTVACARRGDSVCVQVPSRAVLVATALGAALGAAVFFAAPVLLAAAPHVLAWVTDATDHHHLAISRAVWAVVASLVWLVVALRFMGFYARGLAVTAGQGAATEIHYTLSDPRSWSSS